MESRKFSQFLLYIFVSPYAVAQVMRKNVPLMSCYRIFDLCGFLNHLCGEGTKSMSNYLSYAGQFTAKGFLYLRWQRWKRVFFTRCIAIVPTFLTPFFSSIDDLTYLNDILSGVMSLQLPFAVLPPIEFTCNIRIMGSFANGPEVTP